MLSGRPTLTMLSFSASTDFWSNSSERPLATLKKVQLVPHVFVALANAQWYFQWVGPAFLFALWTIRRANLFEDAQPRDHLKLWWFFNLFFNDPMNILVLRRRFVETVGREHLGVSLAEAEWYQVVQVDGVERSQGFLAWRLILTDAFRFFQWRLFFLKFLLDWTVIFRLDGVILDVGIDQNFLKDTPRINFVPLSWWVLSDLHRFWFVDFAEIEWCESPDFLFNFCG